MLLCADASVYYAYIVRCHKYFFLTYIGSIFIDGVDAARLPLSTLRGAIALIPQDPLLFRGSLRSNLDPFSQRSDVQLWEALEKARSELNAVKFHFRPVCESARGAELRPRNVHHDGLGGRCIPVNYYRFVDKNTKRNQCSFACCLFPSQVEILCTLESPTRTNLYIKDTPLQRQI